MGVNVGAPWEPALSRDLLWNEWRKRQLDHSQL